MGNMAQYIASAPTLSDTPLDFTLGQHAQVKAPPPAYSSAAGAPPPPPLAPHHVQYVQHPPGPSLADLPLSQRTEEVARKLDLEHELVSDLLGWAGTEVVIVVDDSGSMSRVADTRRRLTRWEELKERLNQLLEILLLVDDGSGFELKFLNCGGPFMIKSRQDLDACWQAAAPGGGTPLGEVLKPYLNPGALESDRLVMVMTDGCPSDVSFDQLRKMIKGKSKQVYVSVMMCTEEDDVVDQYNRKVDPIPGVDVLDDYASEKREVEKHRGRKLSLNKYLVKCVLGPKFAKWDNMDEDGCKCAIM